MAEQHLATGREGEFLTIAHIGFAGQPPLLPRTSQAGARLIAGHTLSLDDPLAQRRIDARSMAEDSRLAR